MINEYKTDKCIRCGQIETWSHIITCSKLQKERDDFIKRLRKLIIQQSKNTRSLESEALSFVNNIKEYINQTGREAGFQCVLGYKNLFRGYIVRC